MSQQTLNAVELGVFSSRLEAVCDEMGATLRCAALSPNIKDRLDFSCAVFDAQGQLSAQAAHIPVHLGSMAYAMASIVDQCEWQEGDMVVVNDPYLGGTHLPDVTVIAPLFVAGQLEAFIANRAHHAHIGADSPGSMPISTSLEQEGVVIKPSLLVRAGEWQQPLISAWGDRIELGDFIAQVSTNRAGLLRLQELIGAMGVAVYRQALRQLNDYAERMAMSEIATIPAGDYSFTDYMDDDGSGNSSIAINVHLSVSKQGVVADFAGSSAQVTGNINCPLAVTAAAVFYVLRCLMPASTPACAGVFRPISIKAPAASLVNAQYPAAVAAGNVETSTRITDVVLGALAQAIPERIPAASHGSMNNVAMGAPASLDNSRWDYYETIGGGMGAHSQGDGLHCVQTHMTNTLNTPVESLEMHYPLRVLRYAQRKGTGGAGCYTGGDGIEREFEFLRPASATLLTERRSTPPWGAGGGLPGEVGVNYLNDEVLPSKCQLQLKAGDRLKICTPGAGGWGMLGSSDKT